MRTHGTLIKWNDDRGFGFISPAQGNEELFVHVSAFPRDGKRPRLNELISFETEIGPNGKLRAVRVMRPGSHTNSRQAHKTRTSETIIRPASALLVLLAVVVIGTYGYSRLNKPITRNAAESAMSIAPISPAANFKCDGRTMCSQMTSCAEATYFLRHCPNTKMDGDSDGEPCEQQWCN